MAGLRRSGRGGRSQHSRDTAARHGRVDPVLPAGVSARAAPARERATIPAVYSGHNGFWFWGPPPESATDAVVIGDFSPSDLATVYANCELAATVQTPPGVDNDLTGTPIHHCTGLRQPWPAVWAKAANFA